MNALFILSFGRKGLLKRAAPVLLLAVFFAGIFAAGSALINRKRDRRVIGGKEIDVCVRDESDVKRIADVFYSGGKPDEISSVEVMIPRSFNEMYERYNELQKPLGTDLADYKGQKCMKYSLHFPVDDDCGKTVTLLVFDGRFIGGDISSDLFDGEMVSLCDGTS